ncbi:MAG: efflux RND transporter periplasmic adaptor subunit [Desulfobacterales bacterium]|nr:efflux RND transporter periplasmic adaptor subunit [Desulfobacterales bacterium]
MKSILFYISMLLMIIFSLACIKPKDVKPTVKKQRPVPVTIAKVIQKTIPDEIRAIGNVEPFTTVLVKSQVNGMLTKQFIKDGVDISKGDMLFAIDSRLFEIALKEAQAKLERDTALLKKAETDLQRYTDLMQKNVITQEQYDQALVNLKTFRATIKLNEAGIEQAKIDIEHANIQSPISGRAGNVLVNEGNVIKANDERGLVSINQIQPIYVNFSVPEKYLPQIFQYMAKEKLKVSAFIEGDDTKPEIGELSAVDNTVDKATGTIKLKAVFANLHKRLWPGQFVRVILKLRDIENTLVVPSQAIQTGVNGDYVYVVIQSAEKINIVDMRTVTTERILNKETMIASGVSVGESVVTEGQLLLTPKCIVEIK